MIACNKLLYSKKEMIACNNSYVLPLIILLLHAVISSFAVYMIHLPLHLVYVVNTLALYVGREGPFAFALAQIVRFALHKPCASLFAQRKLRAVLLPTRFAQRKLCASPNGNCVLRPTRFAQRKLCASPNALRSTATFSVERSVLGEAHNFR